MTHVPGCPECTRITVALGPGQFERQSGPENDGSDPETGTDQTLEGSSVPDNRTDLSGSAEPTTPTGKRLAGETDTVYDEDAWVEAICAVEREASDRVIEKWDIDNVSIKPFLDGIVERGILEDDSTRQIRGIIKIPFKCKTKKEEKTVIEFWTEGYINKLLQPVLANVSDEGRS